MGSCRLAGGHAEAGLGSLPGNTGLLLVGSSACLSLDDRVNWTQALKSQTTSGTGLIASDFCRADVVTKVEIYYIRIDSKEKGLGLDCTPLSE